MEDSDDTAALGGAAAGTVDAAAGSERGERRRRYFVSLIDESIYKKGVFQRLRRRHKVRAETWVCEMVGSASEAHGFGESIKGSLESSIPLFRCLYCVHG